MSPEESGRLQALSEPPISEEVVESAARILASVEPSQVAA